MPDILSENSQPTFSDQRLLGTSGFGSDTCEDELSRPTRSSAALQANKQLSGRRPQEYTGRRMKTSFSPPKFPETPNVRLRNPSLYRKYKLLSVPKTSFFYAFQPASLQTSLVLNHNKQKSKYLITSVLKPYCAFEIQHVFGPLRRVRLNAKNVY